jgi:hypothetical protein
MHAASITTSDRLQRVWTVLKVGGWWSTMSIITQANVCAVNSVIAELRQNGKQIECKRMGNVWYYRGQK